MQTEHTNTNQDDMSDLHVATIENDGVERLEQIPTPGEVLQAERLRQNLSEKAVSEHLHITMHYVRAIESNRFDKLPGAVFVKGYIKSYALLLGLDANTVAALFEGMHTVQQEMKEEANQRHLAQRRSDRNKPWIYVSAVSFVLVFGGLGVFNYYSDDDGAQQLAPANSESTISSVSTTEPATIASRPMAQTSDPVVSAPDVTSIRANIPQPDSVAAPVVAADRPNLVTALSALAAERAADSAASTATIENAQEDQTEIAPAVNAEASPQVFIVDAAGDDLLRINFSGESWVEVNDSQSRQIYRDIREAGDVLEITGDAPFNILLGDAPFTRMFFNGNEINVSDNIRIDNSARLTVGL